MTTLSPRAHPTLSIPTARQLSATSSNQQPEPPMPPALHPQKSAASVFTSMFVPAQPSASPQAGTGAGAAVGRGAADASALRRASGGRDRYPDTQIPCTDPQPSRPPDTWIPCAELLNYTYHPGYPNPGALATARGVSPRRNVGSNRSDGEVFLALRLTLLQEGSSA